jgi:hypothetical protein
MGPEKTVTYLGQCATWPETLQLMWDFVDRNRRLMKTMKAAQEECEKHNRVWAKACKATGVRALKELFGGKLPLGLPLWARKRLDRRLYAILTDNRPAKKRDVEDESCTESISPSSDAPGPGGPIKTSDSSASPREASADGLTPASPAEGKGRSTILQPRRVRSKATGMSDTSTAPSAVGAAKARKKPAARRTKRASKRAAKRKLNTSASFASVKLCSRGSRKVKSPPPAR